MYKGDYLAQKITVESGTGREQVGKDSYMSIDA
jgi:hypothetical protein